MWLVFIILLNIYLLVKIIKTIIDIWDFFELKKSAKVMAERLKENWEEACQCCEEQTTKGKHSL